MRSPGALREALPRILGATLPLWVLAAAGALAGSRSPARWRAARFALLWLAFAGLAVAVGQRFRPQHFLLLLPPAALLAGLATSALAELARRGRPAVGLGIAAAAAVAMLWGDRALLFRLDGAAASRALHGANPFPEAAAVGAWLREHSEPGDRIAVLGSEPEIYFYAQRRAATPFVYAYELVQAHPEAQRLQQELIARLEAAPPRYLVFVNVGLSWQPAPGVRNRVVEWYRDRVPGSYTQVGQVNLVSRERTDYVWGPDAARAPRSASGWIAVWERRAAPGG